MEFTLGYDERVSVWLPEENYRLVASTHIAIAEPSDFEVVSLESAYFVLVVGRGVHAFTWLVVCEIVLH